MQYITKSRLISALFLWKEKNMKDFETRECVVHTHTHTQLTQIREGTSKCLFSFFKKIGGDKHLDLSRDFNA